MLEKAEAAEKDCNWIEATKIYEQAAASFLSKNMIEEAAGAYKKLGHAYTRAATTAETAEENTDRSKHGVKAYEDAANLFNRTGKRPEELECKAEALYVNGSIAGSIEEGKEAFGQSYELFLESNKLYSQRNEQETPARSLSRAGIALLSLVTYCGDRQEVEKFSREGRHVAYEAWRLSKEIGNLQSLAESLFAGINLAWAEAGTVTFRWDSYWREEAKKWLLMSDESSKLAKDYDDPFVLGVIHLVESVTYCSFGFQFVEDEMEQKEYLDKGLGFMEKALVFARKARDKSLIIFCLFWLDWWAFFGGRFEYVQRRILDDLHEITEAGKIYKGLYNMFHFCSNFLPAFYYGNVALRSFFTSDQRRSYAEKGIEYAEESLKTSSFPMFIAWPYQTLTWSYSQLAILDTAKDERNEHAQKMLQYAKEAEKAGEKFEGGFPRAASYSSLYRAYKTLAEISDNNEEKAKMLTAAGDAAQKYVEHAIESRTGIIAARMRLGLLFEELGIMTEGNTPLMQARESFIHVIRESLERGYYFYSAAGHISVAHIEDRLGNHLVSAGHYEEAIDAYEESLKTVEYKLLRDRVQLLINYAGAWNLIEKAKEYHTREDHLKAKESYNKACEILKQLPTYNYEASYFTAWAMQEEAEQLSKKESHEESAEAFERTVKNFDNAMNTLANASKKPSDRMERERIENLEKLAKVRMNYSCARAEIERARILGKQGEHVEAGERFASAASHFKDISTEVKIQRERGELEAMYYLCRAWESMELAEKYEDSERFAEGANLFTKASELFKDSKLKLLAQGNAAFCKALEYGCKFDKSTEIQVKAQLYPKIKTMLRNAGFSYGKGDLQNGADWALATSTYFDAAWHIIRADEEMKLDEKKKLLGIGSGILRSAAELFGKAGYKSKEQEVVERLGMVEKEEKILFSALNTIKDPAISRSIVGVVAPTSPTETSFSPRIGETQQFTEEAKKFAMIQPKKKYELVYMNLLKEYPRIERSQFRVAVAQIGVSKTGDILTEFYKEKASGLLRLREDKVEMTRSRVKDMIETAHAKGADILLFPELTVDLSCLQLREDVARLAKTYEMYIIPGSYHDEETKRNVCIVIGPDGILWRQEKHIPATIHHEGKRFEEGIEVGSFPKKTFVCDTGFGRIAIAICRDFLDMDLRVELKNFEPPVDLVFNPAFTPVTADFKAAHFDARRSIYAYCFFANVAEFGDSLIYTPERERVERTVPSKEESLIYKDVDLFRLRSERKKWEKERSEEKQFIQSTR